METINVKILIAGCQVETLLQQTSKLAQPPYEFFWYIRAVNPIIISENSEQMNIVLADLAFAYSMDSSTNRISEIHLVDNGSDKRTDPFIETDTFNSNLRLEAT